MASTPDTWPIIQASQSVKKAAKVTSRATIGVLKSELMKVAKPHHAALMGSVTSQNRTPHPRAAAAGASPRAMHTTQMIACMVNVIAETVSQTPAHLPTKYDQR